MERGTELFKQRIKAHLDRMAEADPAFAAKYADPGKSIDGCADHIIAWVERQKRCGFDDDEIYGQAVHYYDEADTGDANHSPCRIVIDEAVALTEEEKEEARKRAMDQLVAEQKARMTRKVTPKPAAPKAEQELTLF
jgi:hypothetical protein